MTSISTPQPHTHPVSTAPHLSLALFSSSPHLPWPSLPQNGASVERVNSEGHDVYHLAGASEAIRALLPARHLASSNDRGRQNAADARSGTIRMNRVVWSRDKSGLYRRGVVTYLSPEGSTCTIKNQDGATIMDVPTLSLLSDEQWRDYTNREANLMAHSRNLKVWPWPEWGLAMVGMVLCRLFTPRCERGARASR